MFNSIKKYVPFSLLGWLVVILLFLFLRDPICDLFIAVFGKIKALGR